MEFHEKLQELRKQRIVGTISSKYGCLWTLPLSRKSGSHNDADKEICDEILS